MIPKVLIALANATEAAEYRSRLSELNYSVFWVNGAIDCAEHIRKYDLSILILDLDLPWGSGWGIINLMREGELPNVPTVLLVNNITEDHPAEKADRLILRKPFQVADVIDAVENLYLHYFNESSLTYV